MSRPARRLYAEHRAVRPVVEQIRAVADALTATGDLRPVWALLERLETQLRRRASPIGFQRRLHTGHTAPAYPEGP